jgi:hypothetical protein
VSVLISAVPRLLYAFNMRDRFHVHTKIETKFKFYILIFTYLLIGYITDFPYFGKIKCLLDHHALCVLVQLPQLTFECLNKYFTKFGMYVIESEVISTDYFINPSHQSSCLSLLSLLGNGLVKTLQRQ